MKQLILKIMILILCGTSSSMAADFDWMKNLNKNASANMDAYKAKLSSRFKLAKAQVGFFMKGIRAPADVYMVLRLSEISGKFPESVLEIYQQKKSQGWVKVAHYVGIKPNSQEFNALKIGHDLKGFETPKTAVAKTSNTKLKKKHS